MKRALYTISFIGLTLILASFTLLQFEDVGKCNLKIVPKVTHTTGSDSSGGIELTVSGGNKPYRFLYFYANGMYVDDKNVKPTTEPTIKNLKKGKYVCVVLDKDNCRKNVEIEIK